MDKVRNMSEEAENRQVSSSETPDGGTNHDSDDSLNGTEVRDKKEDKPACRPGREREEQNETATGDGADLASYDRSSGEGIGGKEDNVEQPPEKPDFDSESESKEIPQEQSNPSLETPSPDQADSDQQQEFSETTENTQEQKAPVSQREEADKEDQPAAKSDPGTESQSKEIPRETSDPSLETPSQDLTVSDQEQDFSESPERTQEQEASVSQQEEGEKGVQPPEKSDFGTESQSKVVLEEESEPAPEPPPLDLTISDQEQDFSESPERTQEQEASVSQQEEGEKGVQPPEKSDPDTESQSKEILGEESETAPETSSPDQADSDQQREFSETTENTQEQKARVRQREEGDKEDQPAAKSDPGTESQSEEILGEASETAPETSSPDQADSDQQQEVSETTENTREQKALVSQREEGDREDQPAAKLDPDAESQSKEYIGDSSSPGETNIVQGQEFSKTPVNDQAKNTVKTIAPPAGKDLGENGGNASAALDKIGEGNSDHGDAKTPGVEFENVKFDDYSIEGVVEVVKKLAQYKDAIKADRVLRRLEERVEVLLKEATEAALVTFTEEGGDKDDFTYKQDEAFNVYDANHRLIKDHRRQFIKKQEREKVLNFARAEDLLDALRKFLEDPESAASFGKFKKIQEEWKSIGSLPRSNYRSLWANYNALVTRFYDRRSIHFELIDLDRKKNLDYKLKMCEKAEALEQVKDLHDAILQLNELHQEFKHVGPVPREEQEKIWLRFKGASDKVYERRKEHNADLKRQFEENMNKKLDLVKQVASFPEFSSEKISDWNFKTKEILALQRAWEELGGLPRNRARDINRDFWKAFKKYFHNKNLFFKKLDGAKTENLARKEEIVKKTEGLMESSDWNKTANVLKELQREWKEIGPVPEKSRKEIFTRFKSACDHFFKRKRENAGEVEKEYEKNLKEKNKIIKEITKLKPDGPELIEELQDLQSKFFDVGFVPRAEIGSVQESLGNAVAAIMESSTTLKDQDKEKMIFESNLERIKRSPNSDRKLQYREDALRKQITELENDISVWNNNLEFFADTKNAGKLKDEFSVKVSEASTELTRLKKELRFFKSA